MSLHHVIIGAGPASTNAIETIRQNDNGDSRITLISEEPAHSRMALPYWIAQKIPKEHTFTGDDAYFANLNVETRFGDRVTGLEPDAKWVTLSTGDSLKFDNLLIATGASPLAPALNGRDLDGVQPLWTLDHTEKLLKATEHLRKPRVVLVGAGFIGFIVLNAMFKREWNLTVVEREQQVLPRMLDATAANIVQTWLTERNVSVHVGTSVQAISQSPDGAKQVQLENGQSVDADVVILATGIAPNLDLVLDTGVKTDSGILVNDQMQTNYPYIYAAGDVAQGPAKFSEQPEIHAIQPTAVDHGRIAGANMSGQEVYYPGSLSMNVVDVCGLQCVSYGNWNAISENPTVICNESAFLYRKLVWSGSQLVGAIFTGRANDLGMLNDVGMVKGILQTETDLGKWKAFLKENPFDIRRAYVAAGVAQKLAQSTLLGRPTKHRQFTFGGAKPDSRPSAHHGMFVNTRQ